MGAFAELICVEAVMVHFLGLTCIAYMFQIPVEILAQRNVPTKSIPFKRKAEDASKIVTEFFQDFGIVPGLELFSFLETQNPHLINFPEELTQALRGDDAIQRSAAKKYLVELAIQLRQIDWARDKDDQFRRAIGKHSQPIRVILERLIRMEGHEALSSASLLLSLEPNHREALAIVVGGLKSQDRRHRQMAYEIVAEMKLSHPEIVAALGEAITGNNTQLQGLAVKAVWKIGRKAGATLPHLINHLRTGKPVYGVVYPYEYPKNLVLLALVEMGAEAEQAVPVLTQLLKSANQDERLELLSCIASIGPNAKDAAPAVSRLLTKGLKDHITAAVTLICIDPDDAKATNIVLAALKSDEKDLRRGASEVCREFGPKVKALILPLVAALKEDNDPNAPLNAAVALWRVGALAAPAIPSLEKLVADDSCSLPTRIAAANALGRAGSMSMHALRRILGNKDPVVRILGIGAFYHWTMDADEIVPILVAALEDDDALVRCSAVKSLVRFNKIAGQARNSITRTSLHDKELNVRIIASWALTQLGK